MKLDKIPSELPEGIRALIALIPDSRHLEIHCLCGKSLHPDSDGNFWQPLFQVWANGVRCGYVVGVEMEFWQEKLAEIMEMEEVPAYIPDGYNYARYKEPWRRHRS